MSKNGGKRPNAGRRPKWGPWDRIKIAVACEKKFRTASQKAAESRLDALPYAAELKTIQSYATLVRLEDRPGWFETEPGEDLIKDFDSLLHGRAGDAFDEDLLEFYGSANRWESVSRKLPRGTRKRILDEVAEQFCLTAKQVDNIWQEYRREMKKRSDRHQSGSLEN